MNYKDKTLKFLKSAIHLALKVMSIRFSSATMITILFSVTGITLFISAGEKYSLALNYIESALKIRKELVINDSTQLAAISTSLMNLGLIYQGNNEIKLAIEKYEEALEIQVTYLIYKICSF